MTDTVLDPLLGSATFVILVVVLFRRLHSVLATLGEHRSVVAAGLVLALLPLATLIPGHPQARLAIGILAMAILLFGAEHLLRRLSPSSSSLSVATATTMTTAPTTTTTTTTTTTNDTSATADIVVIGLFMALFVVVALGSFMWDEASTHWPLGGAVARGLSPLTHPLFPGQPLRYHTAYPELLGMVSAWTHLPLAVAADVVTLSSFAILIAGLVTLARRMTPPMTTTTTTTATATTRAVVVVGTFLLAGPAAGILADGWGAPLPGKSLLPAAWVNGATFPPLVITNVLQHPQGMAMPIAVAMLLLAAGGRPVGGAAPTTWWRIVVVAAFIPLLIRAQVVFAAVVGLGLVVLVLVRGGPWPRRLLALVILGVGGIVALASSGLLAGGDTGLRFGAGYFARDGWALLAHEALAFGASLLALPAAFWLQRRRRQSPDGGHDGGLLWALAAMGTVGFVVANVATYARSWDIVKFFGVSMFFGNVVVAVALQTLWREHAHHLWARFVVVVLCVASLWSGGFWLLRHGVLQGVVAATARETAPERWAVDVVEACGAVISANARVWASSTTLGREGVLSPGTHWRFSRDTAALLLDRPRVEQDANAWQRFARDGRQEDLAILEVSFVVANDSDVRRLHLGERSWLQERCRSPGAVVYECVTSVTNQ